MNEEENKSLETVVPPESGSEKKKGMSSFFASIKTKFVKKDNAPSDELPRDKREPLIRIAKRNNVTWQTKLIAGLSCVGAAILVSILFLWAISGANPFSIIGAIFQGTFGNSIKLWAAIKEIVILLAVALALLPAYKMRFWNVGGQGQILIGALLTAICMQYLGDKMPSGLVIIFSIIFAAVGGALWAYIPAIFKAKWNTNETLFTLMLNYIAVLLVTFFTDRWKGQKSSMGTINSSTKSGWLPTLKLGSAIDGKVLIPLILVILLTVFMYFYLRKTKHGYEIEVVGDSVSTARYTGIPVPHVIRRTLAMSGCICGLVGFFYVAGFDHTLSATTSGGYGFSAVIICWLSNFNPFVMIGYSSLLIFLEQGGRNLSNTMYYQYSGLNEYSTQLAVFLIIIAIMLTSFFIRYRLVFAKDNKVTVKKAEQ